jgi:hypothetical protein
MHVERESEWEGVECVSRKREEEMQRSDMKWEGMFRREKKQEGMG